MKVFVSRCLVASILLSIYGVAVGQENPVVGSIFRGSFGSKYPSLAFPQPGVPSFPRPQCATNYILSCTPSLVPAPCDPRMSSGGYGQNFGSLGPLGNFGATSGAIGAAGGLGSIGAYGPGIGAAADLGPMGTYGVGMGAAAGLGSFAGYGGFPGGFGAAVRYGPTGRLPTITSYTPTSYTPMGSSASSAGYASTANPGQPETKNVVGTYNANLGSSSDSLIGSTWQGRDEKN